MAEGKLAEALQGLSELKVIARCSENMFRLSEKFKQSKQINDAIKSHPEKTQQTYFANIHVTVSMLTLSLWIRFETDIDEVFAVVGSEKVI